MGEQFKAAPENEIRSISFRHLRALARPSTPLWGRIVAPKVEKEQCARLLEIVDRWSDDVFEWSVKQSVFISDKRKRVRGAGPAAKRNRASWARISGTVLRIIARC